MENNLIALSNSSQTPMDKKMLTLTNKQLEDILLTIDGNGPKTKKTSYDELIRRKTVTTEEQFKSFMLKILAWTYGNPLESSIQKYTKKTLAQYLTPDVIKQMSKIMERDDDKKE